jgi:hypothetical protein
VIQVVDAEIEALERARAKAGVTHILGMDEHPSKREEKQWHPAPNIRGTNQQQARVPDGRVLQKPAI